MSSTICRQHDDLGNGPSLDRKLAASSAVLSAAVIAVSASNYLLNVVMARAFTPSQFGDAALVVTLMLVLTAVAVTLQLCTARRIVLEPDQLASVRAHLRGRAQRWGIGVGAALILLSPMLQHVFSTQSAVPFIILAIGVPWYLCQSVDRGILQGQCRFGALALTFVSEAVVRVGVGVSLIACGVGSVSAAISLCASFAAAAAAATILVKPVRSKSRGSSGLATTSEPAPSRFGSSAQQAGAPIAAVATILLVGQVLINNGDVLLAKAVFSPADAGLYASVALIGRAVFFASWAITNAAFPIIADPGLSRRQRRRLSNTAITIVAGFGLGTAMALVPLGSTVARLLFGPSYVGTGSLLAPYALATALFAIANLLATLDVAVGRAFSPVLVLSAAIWQTIILGVVATSPQSMVWLQIMVMAVLTTLLGGLHMLRGVGETA